MPKTSPDLVMTGERCGGPADLVAAPGVLLRLLYLTLTNVLTLIRLLPRNEHDKDAEILALRHQLTVLQRQTDKPTNRSSPGQTARCWPLCSAPFPGYIFANYR